MKLTNLTIKELFTEKAKLTFLVGAGCSVDPPSCLPAVRPMMDAIIKYTCAESEIRKILELEDLRFEVFTNVIHDHMDVKSLIGGYFGQCYKPNLNHFFLAEMINKGHFVMTTNFDFLIEFALLQSGVPNDKIISVITKEDFKKFNDPNILLKKELKALYKIHGSIKNFNTGEDTKETLKITLNDLGRDKEGASVFQIEPFKKPLFNHISDGRNLVVIGYSAPDVFDIVPTLKVIKNIKNLIWVYHVIDNEQSGGRIYEIRDDEIKNYDYVTQILSEIKKTNNAEHVFRVDINTTRLIKSLLHSTPKLDQHIFNLRFYDWLISTTNKPNDILKYYIPYKIYIALDIYEDSMRCSEEILKISQQTDNQKWRAIALMNKGEIFFKKGNLHDAFEYFKSVNEIFTNTPIKDSIEKARLDNNFGLYYMNIGDYNQSLDYFKKSNEIISERGNDTIKPSNLLNIGIIYQHTGADKKALKEFEKVLDIYEKSGNLEGRASVLNRIGEICYDYEKYNEALKRFKEALRIFEIIGVLSQNALCLNNIGKIYYKQGNYEEALKTYKNGLNICVQIGYTKGRVVILNNIGNIFRSGGDLDKALKLYKDALKLVQTQIKGNELDFKLGQISCPNPNCPNFIKIKVMGELAAFIETCPLCGVQFSFWMVDPNNSKYIIGILSEEILQKRSITTGIVKLREQAGKTTQTTISEWLYDGAMITSNIAFCFKKKADFLNACTAYLQSANMYKGLGFLETSVNQLKLLENLLPEISVDDREKFLHDITRLRKQTSEILRSRDFTYIFISCPNCHIEHQIRASTTTIADELCSNPKCKVKFLVFYNEETQVFHTIILEKPKIKPFSQPEKKEGTEIRFCARCGLHVGIIATFCPNCGLKILRD